MYCPVSVVNPFRCYMTSSVCCSVPVVFSVHSSKLHFSMVFTPLFKIFFKSLHICTIVCVYHPVYMYVHTCPLDMSQCQHACILEQVCTMFHMIVHASIFVPPWSKLTHAVFMYSGVIIICTYLVLYSHHLYMYSVVQSLSVHV